MITLAAAAEVVGTGEQWVFWIFAPLAVLGALGMVLARNAVHSALWLVLVMLCLGVFYVVESGPFLGVAQIIVYTGAIMMLFLFVLMLVGRDATDSLIEVLRGQRLAAATIGVGFAGLVASTFFHALRHVEPAGLDSANQAGNVPALAAALFTRYVFAFEVTSALLITAAVGAMLLAHIERDKTQILGQVARMRARFLPGNYPGPKAGPGVYATSNSVATPGRLPDGRASERSIAAILPMRELSEQEAALKSTEDARMGEAAVSYGGSAVRGVTTGPDATDEGR